MLQRGRLFLAVFFLLVTFSPAHGFGWGWFHSSRSTSAYRSSYYPSATYYIPVPMTVAAPVYCPPYYGVAPRQSVPVIMTPPPRLPGYANPTPAPPSQTIEPPTGSGPGRAPKVTESRSSYYQSISTQKETSEADFTCRVGFWNISGRDVVLEVEGRRTILVNNKAITLTLPRSFSWRTDEAGWHLESVATGRAIHEVVIR